MQLIYKNRLLLMLSFFKVLKETLPFKLYDYLTMIYQLLFMDVV